MSNTSIGNKGEAVAAAYLEEQGYKILDQNYRFEHAEIDLVCFEPSPMNDGGELVFVEVKSRSGEEFGRPEDAITDKKQRHLIHAAEAYLYERQLDGAPCRFDVVSVNFGPAKPEIAHIKDAFWKS